MCNFLALNSFFVSFFFSQCFTLTLTTAASCRLMAPQLLKFQESRHRSRPKNDAPYPWRPARHRAQDRSECVDLPRDQAAFGKRPRGPGMQQCEGGCIPRSPVSPATWFACPHRYFRKPPTPLTPPPIRGHIILPMACRERRKHRVPAQGVLRHRRIERLVARHLCGVSLFRRRVRARGGCWVV